VALARLVLVGVTLACAAGAVDLRYWVEPCTRPETSCHKDDPQLADWAMKAWEAASGGALKLEKTERMERAHIRLRWVDGGQGLYGEARPIVVDGRRGAEVYVLPEVAGGSKADPLLRDAIVYLTCLHETGHALGLPHTADFADIMYSFQFGGDIGEYFGRYRRRLSTRADIQKNSGMSPQDAAKLRAVLPRE
jgi:hypothetical protein